jgi:hypothetical protein
VLGRKRHRPIPCLSCGYDITGLAREGVCPECAFALKDTLEASTLLRGCPAPLVQRIRRGVLLLAWSATAPVCGLPLGSIIGMVWALLPGTSGEGAWMGLVVGLIVGLLASAFCFIVGAVLLTRPSPARPLRPAWARLTLRYGGPAGALIAMASPLLLWVPVAIDPVASFLIRAVCQGMMMAALVSMIRVCAAIERQTQTAGTYRYIYNWGVLGVLALIWAGAYWPGLFVRFGLAGGVNGAWGAGWALGALILQFATLWRIVDSVSLEATIAEGRPG